MQRTKNPKKGKFEKFISVKSALSGFQYSSSIHKKKAHQYNSNSLNCKKSQSPNTIQFLDWKTTAPQYY